MSANDFERLAEVMARMAAGDKAAVFTLYEEFGGRLAGAVRTHLRHVGVARPSPDDVDSLVLDACMELSRCAGAWDPLRGVTPWHWARHRLAGIVSSFVGVHAGPLDDGLGGVPADPLPVAPRDDPGAMVTLLALADHRTEARLLLEALVEVTNPRNREILLEVKTQAALGDPAPAATVAAALGLKPATVRQIVRRTLDKLRRLAATDPHFGPLGDLGLLS